jgi:ABC-type antimicrobial peptide transport system permease subunit
VVARTDGDPALLPARLRAELRALDENITLFDARTMSGHLEITFFVDQTAATFLTLFGALALALATIGLFGLISFSINLRTREFGIRMALGADRSTVIGMVLKQGVRLVGIGLVLGLLLSVLVMQILDRVLYGVSPLDPVTFGGVVLLLLAVAIAACWIPARRVVALDPMKTLRYE